MENKVINNVEDIQEQIGKQIKKIREEKGIKNYEKFAIGIDMSRSYYWNVEKGKANLTIKTLCKILNALDVKLIDFMEKIK